MEPCGSMSMSRTFKPRSANSRAMLNVVVVLATPPFWLAITRRIKGFLHQNVADGFHVTHGPLQIAIFRVHLRRRNFSCFNPVMQCPFSNSQNACNASTCEIAGALSYAAHSPQC